MKEGRKDGRTDPNSWDPSGYSPGPTHLKISVWHLLMNLKTNYLLKKPLKWANKKCKNFNIYNVVFFKNK